jgi:hypothetical protein
MFERGSSTPQQMREMTHRSRIAAAGGQQKLCDAIHLYSNDKKSLTFSFIKLNPVAAVVIVNAMNGVIQTKTIDTMKVSTKGLIKCARHSRRQGVLQRWAQPRESYMNADRI